MSIFVMLSITCGASTVMFMFFGWMTLVLPLSAVTALLAITGLFKPVDTSDNQTHPPNTVNNARLTAGFSILLAMMPIFKPYFDDLASQRAERNRATETAPMYRDFTSTSETITPGIKTFYETYGVYPAVNDQGNLYPTIGADGVLINSSQVTFLGTPKDPFDGSRQLTLFPVGQEGALLMSVGQDGEFELPPLGSILAMDGEPKDALAPLAAAGLDFRSRLYNPANGALATGDLMAFISVDETKTMEDTLEPLFKAWEEVDSLTPLPPRSFDPANDIWPPPKEDAQIGADLFKDREYLASLAASSRAVLQRRGHANFWETPELQRAEFMKGRALYELGHYRFASDSFNNFLVSYSKDPEGHYWAGVCYWLGGNRDYALQHLAAGFQLDPNHPIAPDSQKIHDQITAHQPPDLPIPWIIEQQDERAGGSEAISASDTTN